MSLNTQILPGTLNYLYETSSDESKESKEVDVTEPKFMKSHTSDEGSVTRDAKIDQDSDHEVEVPLAVAEIPDDGSGNTIVINTGTDEDHTLSGGSTIQALEGNEEEMEILWPRLKRYKSLLRRQSGSLEFERISLEDYVYIGGSYRTKRSERVEEWVGKVIDIRAQSTAPEQVYIQLYWFYSRQHLKDEIRRQKKSWTKKLTSDATQNLKYLGKHELVLSDHINTFPSGVCIGKAPMYHFDEHGISQPQLPPRGLYWRWLFNLSKPSRKHDKNFMRLPCCNQPSHPDEDVIHFCPSSMCRLWFHAPCIQKTIHRSTRKDVVDSFLANVPWVTDDTVETLLTIDLTEGRAGDNDSSNFIASLQLVPLDILRGIGGQPMVRGGKFGVLGNAAAVAVARRLFFDYQSGRIDKSDPSWLLDIGLTALKTYVDNPKITPTFYYRCPRCKCPI